MSADHAREVRPGPPTEPGALDRLLVTERELARQLDEARDAADAVSAAAAAESDEIDRTGRIALAAALARREREHRQQVESELARQATVAAERCRRLDALDDGAVDRLAATVAAAVLRGDAP